MLAVAWLAVACTDDAGTEPASPLPSDAASSGAAPAGSGPRSSYPPTEPATTAVSVSVPVAPPALTEVWRAAPTVEQLGGRAFTVDGGAAASDPTMAGVTLAFDADARWLWIAAPCGDGRAGYSITADRRFEVDIIDDGPCAGDTGPYAALRALLDARPSILIDPSEDAVAPVRLLITRSEGTSVVLVENPLFREG